MRRTLRIVSATGSVLQCRTASSVSSRKVAERPVVSSNFPPRHAPHTSASVAPKKKILRSGLLVAASALAAIGLGSMSSSSNSGTRTGGWWVPSSDGHLEDAEHKVLSVLKSDVEVSFVELDNGHRVRTMVVNRGQFPDKEPLVLVHGFAAAIGTWAKNIDELAEKRTVYALDQVGFGRSDRPEFSTEPDEAEEQFVENLEQWRAKMELDSFILLGHSLGGFISLSYTFKYPGFVKHLILADPWGMAVRPVEGTEFERTYPIRYKFFSFVGARVSPLGILRAAGPFGPGLMQRARPDLQRVFSDLYPDTTMLEYMYHCNAQQPSGELAMKSLMSKNMGFATNPMLERIGDVPDGLNVSFIYGERSWNDSVPGEKTREILGKSRVDVTVLPDANHHVYGFDGFNQVVNEHCRQVDVTQSVSPHLPTCQ
ncbi:(Lyso)-N-acylphosphatidylethanolamine lipase-like isoform X1 [Sycon ciliatum]|uniref:(Lyso)-N-acylphosphatidylethanolamine lipase-like isoform X1 n=1 Tax=Sycon ciliatum TaxID=27933 RepID=UPI0031F6CF7D